MYNVFKRPPFNSHLEKVVALFTYSGTNISLQTGEKKTNYGTKNCSHSTSHTQHTLSFFFFFFANLTHLDVKSAHGKDYIHHRGRIFAVENSISFRLFLFRERWVSKNLFFFPAPFFFPPSSPLFHLSYFPLPLPSFPFPLSPHPPR